MALTKHKFNLGEHALFSNQTVVILEVKSHADIARDTCMYRYKVKWYYELEQPDPGWVAEEDLSRMTDDSGDEPVQRNPAIWPVNPVALVQLTNAAEIQSISGLEPPTDNYEAIYYHVGYADVTSIVQRVDQNFPHCVFDVFKRDKKRATVLAAAIAEIEYKQEDDS